MSRFKDFRIFLFSYNYEGAEYSVEIPATNEEEAKQRLSRLAFAKYDGELMYKIPASPGAGILVRLVTWTKNRLQSK